RRYLTPSARNRCLRCSANRKLIGEYYSWGRRNQVYSSSLPCLDKLLRILPCCHHAPRIRGHLGYLLCIDNNIRWRYETFCSLYHQNTSKTNLAELESTYPTPPIPAMATRFFTMNRCLISSMTSS